MDIEQIRVNAEEYRGALELERLAILTQHKTPVGRTAVDRRFSRVASRSAIEQVEAGLADAEKRGLPEESRRLRRLRTWQLSGFAEREVRAIDDRIEETAHSSRFINLDGRSHALRNARPLLGQAANPAERIRLDAARSAAALELTPLLSERLGICQGIARSFGHDSYLELWQSSLGADLDALRGLAETVLAETDDMYREVLGWTLHKRLGLSLEEAHQRDIPYVLAARYSDYADCFSAQSLVSKAQEFLAHMGLSLSCDGRLKTLISQPVGAPRAFVSAPKIPGDVRLVLQLGDSQRDALSFLNALGRALFLAGISPQAPFEDRVLGDESLDHAYGLLFQNLLLDRRWLQGALGFKRPKDYLLLASLDRLYYLRLICGRTLYELELFSRGTTDGMQRRYVELFRRAICVEVAPEFYLHEARRPFQSVTQLRGQIYECLFTQHLSHYFDRDWWHNPRAGPFLRQEWQAGRRLDVEARATEMSYDGLILSPLLKQLDRHL